MFITKDELYSWQITLERDFAEAEIPDELGQKLQDALNNYKKICEEVEDYVDDHPDCEI